MLAVHDSLAVNDAVNRDIHITCVDCEFCRHGPVDFEIDPFTRHLIISLLRDSEKLVETVLSERLNLGQALFNLGLHGRDLGTDQLIEAFLTNE